MTWKSLVTPRVHFNEQLQINIGVLGVKSPPVGEFQRLGLTAAIGAASSDAFHMSVVILRSLGRAITGNIQQGEVGGPVRIAEISGTVLEPRTWCHSFCLQPLFP